MDLLQEKHCSTSRGFRYRYYASHASAEVSDSKPVLLLCHGWPDGAELWQYMIPQLLQSQLRILAPDLLGYGGTSKPTAPAAYELAGMTADLLELVAAEGVPAQQPLLPVGHDWGAWLAQRFYQQHAARCAGLATLAVAYSAPSTQPFDLDAANAATEASLGYPAFAYWELFTRAGGPALVGARLESMWHAMHGAPPDWTRRMFCARGAMEEFLRADRRDVPLRPYARDARLRDGWIARLAEGGMEGPCCWYSAMKENCHLATEMTLPKLMEKPYLFIGCDGDPVCKAEFVKTPMDEGLLKDATVHHSGHWCPYEKPDEVGSLLLAWLKGKGFAA